MKKLMLFTSLTSLFPRAFANAGWKLDADGKIEMKDGNPVYLKEDGSEAVIEGNTISRLNGEAKANRERAEAAEMKAKAFDGLDPVAAKKALDTLKNIDQKKLIDAGEIERVRDEISKNFTAQITERDEKLSASQKKLDKMMLDNAFASSNFVRERVAVPPEMFRSFFGNNFKIEDEKIIAHDASGNKIYSTKRIGELADVDEAFEILVASYAHKDSILKAQNQSGSGNNGGGGSRGGVRSMTRADFEKLTPAKQAEAAGLQRKGELTVND